MAILTLPCRSASPSGQHHSPISSRHHSSSSQSGSSVQRHSPSPHRKRTPSPSYQRTASPPTRRSSSPYPPRSSSSPQRKRSPSRHRSPGREKGRHDRDRTSQSHDRRHERRDGMNKNNISNRCLFADCILNKIFSLWHNLHLSQWPGGEESTGRNLYNFCCVCGAVFRDCARALFLIGLLRW